MINTVGPNWPYFYGVGSFMHKAIAISMASIFLSPQAQQKPI
jgi:hypothetical protein